VIWDEGSDTHMTFAAPRPGRMGWQGLDCTARQGRGEGCTETKTGEAGARDQGSLQSRLGRWSMEWEARQGHGQVSASAGGSVDLGWDAWREHGLAGPIRQ
jgi:hypothetical protein